MKLFKMRVLILALLTFSLASCNFEEAKKTTQRSTVFIGVDVSGSFAKTKKFSDGMAFLSHYIHAHLNNENGLAKPVDLYVGGIGGDKKEDPQDFFPVHDFMGLSKKGIQNKLTREFSRQRDNLTDFNTFFRRIKSIVKQKNLVLAPIEVIMVTDGVPEIANRTKKAIKQAYQNIEFKNLENLSRTVSVRILYASPKVGRHWRKYVPTKKIKVWTVEPRVMYGWKSQLQRNGKKALHKWIMDNIDLRLKSRG